MKEILASGIRRLVVALLGALVVTGAMVVALTRFEVWGEALEVELYGSWFRLEPTGELGVVLLACAVALLLGSLLLGLAIGGTTRRRARVFHLNPHGDGGEAGLGRITVAEAGLKSLMIRAAEELDGVSGVSPSLTMTRSGWRIQCTVSVWRDAVLPELALELKNRLRHELETHTGLQVHRVDLALQHAPSVSTRVV